VSVAEDVRRFAEDPAAWGEISPESGLERVRTDRYCILFGRVSTFTHVSRLRLDPDEIPEAIAEIRRHVADRGHREASWHVGSSATPPDLVDRLRAHGLVPDDRPGSEPHSTTLVLAEEPPAGPPGVETRRVESLEEFRVAGAIGREAFGSSPDEEEAWNAVAEAGYEAERAGHAPRVYLGFLDGRPVGIARALIADDCPAVLMIAGGVVPAARGRGVYRALVRARWDDAVAAGIPALCTHAGAMSRPILDRLGFQAVAEHEVLLDPATC
jgi:GNAT superfamily N-acetyltransferase